MTEGITYTTAPNLGSIFTGFGALVLMLVAAYVFYRIYKKLCDYIDIDMNKDIKYSIIEEVMLDRIATKKGIDLKKEMLERQVLREKPKRIKQRLHEQIYDELFERIKVKP